MSFENYTKRKNNIVKWLPDWIDSHFTSFYDFGHLSENHLNATDQFLMNRAKKERHDSSTFVGTDSAVLKMLHETLKAQYIGIAEYLADTEWTDECVIAGTLPETVAGKAFLFDHNLHDWADGAKPCTEFLVIIKKTGNTFYVKTAYPL